MGEKTNSKNKRLMINLISSIIALAVQMGISLVLTPILVEKLGNEAYGFIGLANNFVSYATIITVALNSMASRFITIAIHRNEEKKANEYFSSVFLANIIMSVVILILLILMIANLNSLLDVPSYLEQDVKITFILVFINFIITLLSTVFTVATFVKNRVDLSSIQQTIGNLLKVVAIIILFWLFQPKIYFISIAAIVYTLYVMIANIHLTKKLAPELKIDVKNFKGSAVLELIKSGLWNSLSNLSSILLNGLDLLIANLFIDSVAMGTLSIAKTIPTAVLTLLGTISRVFLPQFTILYSKNKINELVGETKFSIKVLSLIMIVPLAGFIVFGQAFFTLWLPSKTPNEIIQIQILSVLTLLPNLVSSYIYTLYSINTVINKLKVPVIVTLVLGVVSVIITYILVKTTNLGVYAIAGVSSIILLLKVLIFVPIYAAKNLNVKKRTFYGTLLRATITSVIIIILFAIINMSFKITSWGQLIICAIIAGGIGYIVSFMCLLNRTEKNKVKEKILKFRKA